MKMRSVAGVMLVVPALCAGLTLAGVSIALRVVTERWRVR